jgi:hypothetical protein
MRSLNCTQFSSLHKTFQEANEFTLSFSVALGETHKYFRVAEKKPEPRVLIHVTSC